MNQNLKDFLFFGALILLALLLFGSGCGTMHRILHPFSPSPVATENTFPAAVQPATGLVSAPAPSGLHLFTPAPAQAPVPVKLASGQTVLMVPAVAPAPAPAPATPVKSALSKLLVLVWIAGLLCIAAGVALIVWASQLWLGLKLIGCSQSVASSPPNGFTSTTSAQSPCCSLPARSWIILDHLITWSAVVKWLHKQEDTIKKNI